MSTIDLVSSLADEAVVQAFAERLAPFIAQQSIAIPTCWGDWSRVHVGSRVQVVNALFNVASGDIWVGDDTFFGHNVCVLTGTHDTMRAGAERTQHPTEGRDIRIGQGVWIASNATVLGPCTIGDYAVVCAGSVVIGDVAAGWLYGGVPARPIRPCFGEQSPGTFAVSSATETSPTQRDNVDGGLTVGGEDSCLASRVPNNFGYEQEIGMSAMDQEPELVESGSFEGQPSEPGTVIASFPKAVAAVQPAEPLPAQSVGDDPAAVEQAVNHAPEVEWLKERVMHFLGHLVGADKAPETLDKVLDPNEQLQLLAMSIAGTVSFERLFKLVRTCNIQQSVSKESDPDYVGVANFDCKAPFAEIFHTHFAPLLEKRADGFSAIFSALAEQNRKPLIIETGCLRVPGNWDGDGQSTFLFDTYAQQRGGWVYSIDINFESIASARRACSHTTQFILNDSVAALNALSSTLPTAASLLYLDSFDLDIDNPTPSAIHHVLELAAARPLLGPGTVVVVDDFGIGAHGGKGMIVNDFFSRSSAEVLYDGYQKVWRMR
jgi:acetyltransferase-like isoleucine patch superfamily enzyme